jgi:hypothetical protein
MEEEQKNIFDILDVATQDITLQSFKESGDKLIKIGDLTVNVLLSIDDYSDNLLCLSGEFISQILDIIKSNKSEEEKNQEIASFISHTNHYAFVKDENKDVITLCHISEDDEPVIKNRLDFKRYNISPDLDIISAMIADIKIPL